MKSVAHPLGGNHSANVKQLEIDRLNKDLSCEFRKSANFVRVRAGFAEEVSKYDLLRDL